MIFASIPPPPIQNLTLGPFTLHLYGLILGVAVIVAFKVSELLLNSQGEDGNRVVPLIFPAVIAGFIGARLYHVISRPAYFAENPGEIFMVWNGGLGIWGAIGVGAAVGIWRVHRAGLNTKLWMDAIAPGIAFSQAIGRWGNYVNQELYGGPTSLPWGLRLTQDALPEKYQDAPNTTFHPTFLYESLGLTILGLALALGVVKWQSRPLGSIFALYVIGYCAMRFPIEGLRVDEAHVFWGLRQNEWVALVLGLVATVALIRLFRTQRQSAAPTAND
jgi:prolipoprotein diacylglyceryl transferase